MHKTSPRRRGEAFVFRRRAPCTTAGFPTTNIDAGAPETTPLTERIYAVYGWVDGQRLPGLLHLGPRPTFAGFAPTVELWLMDWSGDLYGRRVRVEFVHRLRDILPFTSVDALIAAMQEDARRGREILSEPHPG